MLHGVTANRLETFKRFLKLLPHEKDPDIVLLTGRTLVEEQVRQLIDD
jgi:hypothetical protein